MVKQNHPVDGDERVMKTQLDHSGAEPDVTGALGGSGDEDVWRGDVLPTCAVVLANPDLFVAEPVEELYEFEVSFQGKSRMFGRVVYGL